MEDTRSLRFEFLEDDYGGGSSLLDWDLEKVTW